MTQTLRNLVLHVGASLDETAVAPDLQRESSTKDTNICTLPCGLCRLMWPQVPHLGTLLESGHLLICLVPQFSELLGDQLGDRGV